MRAAAAASLSAAGAASTETLVRLVNPDWSDEQVADEVKLIHAAAGLGATMADPTKVGIEPADPEESDATGDNAGASKPTDNGLAGPPPAVVGAVQAYARGISR